MGRKTRFQDAWMARIDSNGDRASLYIVPTEDPFRARCTWCKSDMDTSSRGFLSIDAHAQKKKHRQVSEFFSFEVSKECEIQVANIKQGHTPGQAVFGGVAAANQAEDEEAVDDPDVVTIGDREMSQRESQMSQPSQ